ncbi:CmcI family methyltransferase [Candidatus Mycobacterium wuenschmannii]|uniref:CmcI family methyltransferase n=1 Tax=Candidatus Mycobacterium wuenschmannii TaxID=3027808 RepID=A0ABY8VQ26_9MYCO|nr:CmcI family methyltransferase [Candidatus Mycobacterium wuenschmannii]WIM85728.1 CmcI family methyltransferase [Candidatus Mycobacterium wuenschmannii]
MGDLEEFAEERRRNIARLGGDEVLANDAVSMTETLIRQRYVFNFDWLGLPIIQFPPDIIALQEICWKLKPAVVIETGIARGGSLALYASMMQLLGSDGFVIGVDVDIRRHNREAIEAHPLANRIKLVEGSSTDPDTVATVKSMVGNRGPVLVVLDSLHTKDHALAELEIYSPLVTPGSFVIVQDTAIEVLSEDVYPDRPWHHGNSPANAVDEFLARPDCRFVVDEDYASKLVFTSTPGGFLRCVA